MNTGVLGSLSESVGDDEQNCILYSIDILSGREGDSSLGRLYEYWCAAQRKSNNLPHVRTFHPEAELPDAVTREIAWVDVRSGDPATYVVNALRPVSDGGFDIEVESRCGDAFPDLLRARVDLFEYHCCKQRRKPQYQEIRRILKMEARHFTRVLLPVVDADGSVTKIYCATRNLRPPIQIEDRKSFVW